MHKIIRQLATAAAVAAAALLPQVHAAIAVVDFEGDSLTGLYLPGDTFSQAGFVMTQFGDFGTVDHAAALGSVAPTGNDTQFYFNSNSGGMALARADGSAFTLESFSVAFVPLNPPASQTVVLIVQAWDASNNYTGYFFPMGNTSSGASQYPFETWGGQSAYYKDVVYMEFFACAYTSSVDCSLATTANNAQFALDNIVTTVVPEPATVALMAVGLLGLALRTRRSTR